MTKNDTAAETISIDTPELADLRAEAKEELIEMITCIDLARYYRTPHRRMQEDKSWRLFQRWAFETHGVDGINVLSEELRDSCDSAIEQHLDYVARCKAERARPTRVLSCPAPSV